MSDRREKELAQAILKLEKVFGEGDPRITLWLQTSNPVLGGAIPIHYYLDGYGFQMNQLIDDMIRSRELNKEKKIDIIK